MANVAERVEQKESELEGCSLLRTLAPMSMMARMYLRVPRGYIEGQDKCVTEVVSFKY